MLIEEMTFSHLGSKDKITLEFEKNLEPTKIYTCLAKAQTCENISNLIKLLSNKIADHSNPIDYGKISFSDERGQKWEVFRETNTAPILNYKNGIKLSTNLTLDELVKSLFNTHRLLNRQQLANKNGSYQTSYQHNRELFLKNLEKPILDSIKEQWSLLTNTEPSLQQIIELIECLHPILARYKELNTLLEPLKESEKNSYSLSYILNLSDEIQLLNELETHLAFLKDNIDIFEKAIISQKKSKIKISSLQKALKPAILDSKEHLASLLKVLFYRNFLDNMNIKKQVKGSILESIDSTLKMIQNGHHKKSPKNNESDLDHLNWFTKFRSKNKDEYTEKVHQTENHNNLVDRLILEIAKDLKDKIRNEKKLNIQKSNIGKQFSALCEQLRLDQCISSEEISQKIYILNQLVKLNIEKQELDIFISSVKQTLIKMRKLISNWQNITGSQKQMTLENPRFILSEATNLVRYKKEKIASYHYVSQNIESHLESQGIHKFILDKKEETIKKWSEVAHKLDATNLAIDHLNLEAIIKSTQKSLSQLSFLSEVAGTESQANSSYSLISIWEVQNPSDFECSKLKEFLREHSIYSLHILESSHYIEGMAKITAKINSEQPPQLTSKDKKKHKALDIVKILNGQI